MEAIQKNNETVQQFALATCKLCNTCKGKAKGVRAEKMISKYGIAQNNALENYTCRKCKKVN